MNFTYTFPSLNKSVQVGDLAYYSRVQDNHSGTNHSSAIFDTKPRVLGMITQVNYITQQIVINTNLGGGCGICSVLDNNGQNVYHFVFFQKDHRINTSGITGYFLNAEYRNYSRFPAEIFATAVDYVESSK